MNQEESLRKIVVCYHETLKYKDYGTRKPIRGERERPFASTQAALDLLVNQYSHLLARTPVHHRSTSSLAFFGNGYISHGEKSVVADVLQTIEESFGRVEEQKIVNEQAVRRGHARPLQQRLALEDSDTLYE